MELLVGVVSVVKVEAHGIVFTTIDAMLVGNVVGQELSDDLAALLVPFCPPLPMIALVRISGRAPPPQLSPYWLCAFRLDRTVTCRSRHCYRLTFLLHPLDD